MDMWDRSARVSNVDRKVAWSKVVKYNKHKSKYLNLFVLSTFNISLREILNHLGLSIDLHYHSLRFFYFKIWRGLLRFNILSKDQMNITLSTIMQPTNQTIFLNNFSLFKVKIRISLELIVCSEIYKF